MSIPYERVVAWAAGPIAIAAGSVAVWLDNHFGLLGKAGLGSDQTAKAINDALTFAVGAGVTYLSQAKWMTNLAAWWGKTQTVIGPPMAGGSGMTTEDNPQEEQQERPFVDEPGYDEPGPGVEPDQELDDDEEEQEETKTLEDGEAEDVGPDTA